MLAFIMEDLEDVSLDHADKVRVVLRLIGLPLGFGAPGTTLAHSLNASFELWVVQIGPHLGNCWSRRDVGAQMSRTQEENGQFPQRGSDED